MEIPVITNPDSGTSDTDRQDTWRHSANHTYWQADKRLPVNGKKEKQEKILFIVPPYVSHENFVSPTIYEATMLKNGRPYKNVVADMPLAFLSMSAYLKEHANVDIKCTDFNVTLNKLDDFEYESFEAMFHGVLSSKEFIEFAPDIIGISSLFVPSYLNTLDIAKTARDLFPNAFIIAGGSVATTMYQEIYDVSDSFDALCFGEGELPLLH